MHPNSQNKVILCILDGFGFQPKSNKNAISFAKTPNFDYLFSHYPCLQTYASGIYVGLPAGQIGNSEVGHITIGSGRVYKQFFTYINDEIASGKFFKRELIIEAIKKSKQQNSRLHVTGLFSDGGVHSHISHLKAFLQLATQLKQHIYIHIIGDGRDTAPEVLLSTIKEFLIWKRKNNILCEFASVSGRYYAMDRDKRWDRLQKSIDALFCESTNSFEDIEQYLNDQYKNNISDEFIEPAYNKKLMLKIETDDVFVMFNFRQDRAIEISSALTNSSYEFKYQQKFQCLNFYSFCKYSDSVKGQVFYAPKKLHDTLGKILADSNFSQLRIAETEKTAHVTFFFDGGETIDYKNEAKVGIPSPKVKTYDLKPEMSAVEVTDKLLKTYLDYEIVILNFANADMVGHTGDFKATVQAVETLDTQIKRIYESAQKNKYQLIITADHGNAEIMLDENNNIVKKHTTSKVPLCFVVNGYKLISNSDILKQAQLADIAPTILAILGVSIPQDMTGKVLLKKG